MARRRGSWSISQWYRGQQKGNPFSLMNHETRQRHRNTLKEELFCCLPSFTPVHSIRHLHLPLPLFPFSTDHRFRFNSLSLSRSTDRLEEASSPAHFSPFQFLRYSYSDYSKRNFTPRECKDARLGPALSLRYLR